MADKTKKKTKAKHAGGRPTAYKAEYATGDFFLSFVKDCEEKESLVGICSLAVYCESTEKTLYNWAEIHPQFLQTIDKLRQYSKNMLVNNGLNKKYSDRMTRLLLSANHGVHEKTEQDLNIGISELYKDICGDGTGITIKRDQS